MLSAAFGLPNPWKLLELDTVSHVTSLPSAPAQHWHRDTTKALHSTPDAALAPVHCVTLFVPLTKVEAVSGPTEMLLGSHLGCNREEQRAIQVPSEGGGSWRFENECPFVVAHKPWKATAEAGAAILFDSRLMHRGGPNKSPRPRPQIYVTFAQQWFVDRVNFHEPQSRAMDAVRAERRNLLSRIGAREYVAELEELLEKQGVNIDQLRTTHTRYPDGRDRSSG